MLVDGYCLAELSQGETVMPDPIEKCGRMYKSNDPWGKFGNVCRLPKGHEGPCGPIKKCSVHGDYVGEHCPHWPTCKVMVNV